VRTWPARLMFMHSGSKMIVNPGHPITYLPSHCVLGASLTGSGSGSVRGIDEFFSGQALVRRSGGARVNRWQVDCVELGRGGMGRVVERQRSTNWSS
jgi:hypothetical protein